MKCVLCKESDANSAEHIVKASVLKEIFKDLRKLFPDQQQTLKAIEIKNTKKSIIQGPNSDIVKYKNKICKNCNNSVSQKFDLEIDRLISDAEITPHLISINQLIEMYGFLIVFRNNKLISDQGDEVMYMKVDMKFNLFFIYHNFLLNEKLESTSLCKDKNPLVGMINRFINLYGGRENTTNFEPAFFEDIELKHKKQKSKFDKNKLAGYFSKQIICSVTDNDFIVTENFNNIFIKNIIPSNIKFDAILVTPYWRGQPSISLMVIMDIFVSKNGELVYTIYHELGRGIAFLCYFTISNPSREELELLDSKRATYLGYGH